MYPCVVGNQSEANRKLKEKLPPKNELSSNGRAKSGVYVHIVEQHRWVSQVPFRWAEGILHESGVEYWLIGRLSEYILASSEQVC